jgi:hypothetical protein
MSTAYHEAGHGVMAYHLGGRVVRLTIEPEWDEASRPDGDTHVEWPIARMTGGEFQEAGVLTALAGPVAEMHYAGERFHPALVAEWARDWDEAERLAAEFIPLPEARAKYLAAQTRRVWDFFDEPPHWSAVAALADELEAHETLDAEQVEGVLEFWLS